MTNFFMEKSQVKIVVVEPAGSVRFIISDLLRELGFGQCLGVASGKDVLQVLEAEPVHWLIMPLLAGEDTNALKILRMIIQNSTLRHIRTSLLIDPDAESWCLTQAFELGLLSWHKRSYVKEILLSDFRELLSLLELNSWNSTLTSAEYLRGFLINKGYQESRMALEQNLLSLFPGNPKILLALAEAELDRGNKDKGERILNQAELLDDSLKIHCKRLREKHTLSTAKRNEGEIPRASGGENLLGIKTAVIIDPDTDSYCATIRAAMPRGRINCD